MRFAAASVLFIGFLLLGACHFSREGFEILDGGRTGIRFENNLQKEDHFGILYYLYYYNGGGVAVGDINNDGLPDIYFTANSRGHNKLYLNKGDFHFEDITESAGVAGTSDWCSGVTMADVNGDGFLDIYVSAVSQAFELHGHNELFINNGNGTFTERSAEYGLNYAGFAAQACFFDYDHDGDLDCFVLSESLTPNERIVDTGMRHKPDLHSGGRLFRNDLKSTGKFTDVTDAAGIFHSTVSYGLGLAVGDINNDGWDDIYVGNDFHENDYYYVNNGNGTFTESAAKYFNHFSRFSMGNDLADYNNDGNADIVTVDMLPPDEKVLKTYGSDERVDIYNYKIILPGYLPQFSRNCLHRNNGDGKSFSDVALMDNIYATDWSWSPLLADFDNDGNKDLFVSSGIVKRPGDLDYIRFVSELSRQRAQNPGANLDERALEKMPDGASKCFVFRNDGAGGFSNKTNDWGFGEKKGYFNGAAYADLDGDGRLDVVVNALNGPAFIGRNNLPRHNFLDLRFAGDSANRFGIGAKAWVFARGRMQYQQLMLTRGFQSATAATLHFGLDSAERADSLLIVWPDQRYQWLHGVAANRVDTLRQSNASGSFDHAKVFPPRAEELKPLPSLLATPWRHKEDEFNDYDVQYLIMHQQSKRGPHVAVADVNHDGLDDFFVGGSETQPGTLFIQLPDGHYAASDTALFNRARGTKATDAVFFDANGDGYADLFIASGGNDFHGQDARLIDHLYLNDGHGHFAEGGKLPALFANKSTVAAADADGDGDIDLFIGVLADPVAYGVPQTSYLLLNDGHGNFSVAPKSFIDLDQVGMVSASVFTDLNGDGRPDLAIAGEWLPVTIFLNTGKGFQPTQPANASGIWQSLQVADLNGDGKPDLLAGNWGLNSKLKASDANPLNLYVGDFDKNGRMDQVLAYTIDGLEYPFLPKDEFEQVIPRIKRNFLYYADYAGKQVIEIFDTAGTVHRQVRDMASAVFLNDGQGGFVRRDFAAPMQLTPLYVFAPLAGKRWLAGGNMFGVLPYEGAYDAAALTSFSATHGADGRVIDIKGQVRDMKWLRNAQYGKVLLVTKNNEPPAFYAYQ